MSNESLSTYVHWLFANTGGMPFAKEYEKGAFAVAVMRLVPEPLKTRERDPDFLKSHVLDCIEEECKILRNHYGREPTDEELSSHLSQSAHFLFMTEMLGRQPTIVELENGMRIVDLFVKGREPTLAEKLGREPTQPERIVYNQIRFFEALKRNSIWIFALMVFVIGVWIGSLW